MPTNAAVMAALDLSRDPSLAKVMRHHRLPDGISVLLRALAEVDTALPDAARQAGCHEIELLHAAEFYVQSVMLYPGSPAERVLGISSDAPRESARAHMRWLMIWLHPDKASNDWRSAFAGRVLDAWNELSRNVSRTDPVENITTSRGHAREQRRQRVRAGVRLRWTPIYDDAGQRIRNQAVLSRNALVGILLLGGIGGLAYLTQPSFMVPIFAAVSALGSSGVNDRDAMAHPHAP